MRKTIKNSWKQFGEWAIELEGKAPAVADIFSLTRLRLAILYFVATFVVLLPFGIWSDSLINKSLHHQLSIAFEDPVVAESVASATLEEYNRSRWVVRIGGAVALFTLSYLLALITLRPLKRVFDSQRHFIANASHELRTPLAIMRTTSEVTLMNREPNPKEAFKAVKNNLEEIKRMSDTLQVLLNFSGYNRAEQLRFSSLNLYEVVSRAVQLARPAARMKQLRLIFSGENPSMVKGNSAALEEMALNLLKNAIAYTPQGGLVNVVVAHRGGTVNLSVKDTGIGISEIDLPHIFDPFYRGTNYGLAKNSGGTGLGLAIVKEIGNLHHAKVEVKSEPEIGTLFSVNFAAAKR